MAELEDQLRAYADQVEESVPSTPVVERSRRRPIWLAAVAVVVVVIGIAGIVLFADDAAEPDVEIDSLYETDDETIDLTTTTFTPDNVTDPTYPTPESAFGPAPLADRHDTLVFRTPTEVIVWGGDVEPFNIGRPDLDDAVYNDGAIFRLLEVDGTSGWRAMAPSPLPAIDRRPVAIALDGSDQPRILIVRGVSAAIYDVADDRWTELPDAPAEIRELIPAPEFDTIVAVRRGGVSQFDAVSGTWIETGPFDEWDLVEHELFPTAGVADPSVVWTGEELVAVSGSLDGVFPVQTWTPGGGWESRGTVTSGSSQVALDTAWVDGEVWIVGYDMTVHAWDPATATARSLPPLPILFQEGTPEISALADGRVVVDRFPGLAVWNGAGWEVEPALHPLGIIAPGLDGQPAAWSYELGREAGDGNSLQVVALPRAGEVRTVLVSSFAIGLANSESLGSLVGRQLPTGEMEIIAQINGADGTLACTFWNDDGVSPETDVLQLGSRGLAYSCVTGGVEPFVSRITDIWDLSAEPGLDYRGERTVVPSLVGLFSDNGIETAGSVGLRVVVQFRTVPVGSPEVGVVVAQVPAADELTTVGAEILLIVGEAGS